MISHSNVTRPDRSFTVDVPSLHSFVLSIFVKDIGSFVRTSLSSCCYYSKKDHRNVHLKISVKISVPCRGYGFDAPFERETVIGRPRRFELLVVCEAARLFLFLAVEFSHRPHVQSRVSFPCRANLHESFMGIQDKRVSPHIYDEP